MVNKSAGADPWRSLEKHVGSSVVSYRSGFRHPLKPGVTCVLHDHPTLEIVYHRTGHGRTRMPGLEDVTFEEGDCVIYAPRQFHDQVLEDSGEDLCVHIVLPDALSRGLTGCILAESVEPWVGEEIYRIARHPEQTESARRVLDYRASAVLLALLRQQRAAAQEVSASERHVRLAERHIRRHFAEIRSVGEIARAVGLSADRLRHVFKEARGQSLVACLNRVRVEHAQSLLAHSGLPLKQVATLCGFRDEYYFSAVFRRLTGKPPGATRTARG